MEKKSNPNLILSEHALKFVAEITGKPIAQLTIEQVTGGYSRNRRGIVHTGDESLFVKEVDESLLPGDGQEERDWLAKDHGVMELLRSEGIDLVPERSWLSVDSKVLMMTSYPVNEGWLWDLPEESSIQQNYVDAVVSNCNKLESATFTKEDIERLNLTPYFRDKLSDPEAHQNFFELDDAIDNLVERFELLAVSSDNPQQRVLLHSLAVAVQNESSLEELSRSMSSLRKQPNEVFSHCDTRIDNLAYNPKLNKLVMVDWNWASQTPKKFGSTEFLISVAVRGVDISKWYDEINIDLLATLVVFWSRCCMKAELTETGNLRDTQALSAAVAYDLFTKLG